MKYICVCMLLLLFSCKRELYSSEESIKIKSDEAIRSSNQFAFNLYESIREEKGNIFFSPFGLSVALTMTYMGASSLTKEQMGKVLGIDSNNIHKSYGSLVAELNLTKDKGEIDFISLQHLWGEQQYPFSESFVVALEKNYESELTRLDFINDAQNSRMVINKWAEEGTNGKIKDLIPENLINSLTRLVLTNAIYFKGNWQRPFDKKATKNMSFNISSSEKKEVAFMEKKDRVNYMEDELIQMVGIPFKGGDISFNMILPKKMDNLSGIEQGMNSQVLDVWMGKMREQEVQLIFPKINMEKSLQLKNILANMGMPLAFSDDADFSLMHKAGLKDLKISEVVHKAYIDVNEEGAEAAAASAVIMMTKSLSMPKVFFADHPFIFIIMDNKSKTILFIGRFTN